MRESPGGRLAKTKSPELDVAAILMIELFVAPQLVHRSNRPVRLPEL